MNLHKHVWTEALQMDDFRTDGDRNKERLKKLVGLAEGYEKRVKEETELTKEQLTTRYVGKLDPKKRTPFSFLLYVILFYFYKRLLSRHASKKNPPQPSPSYLTSSQNHPTLYILIIGNMSQISKMSANSSLKTTSSLFPAR